MTESNDGSLPTSGRLVGIDFGTVRIGIAVSDAQQSLASPLETYARRNEKLDAEYFIKLVADESVVGFVIGLPVHMSGDESEKSKEAREFGTWLAAQTGVPIDWIDERYTTSFARATLSQSGLSGKKRKAMLDKIAAQAILSTFLESDRSAQFGKDPSSLD